eukprot:CAMPEP_0117038530 /NCGR_PEP_ID=MMETSP0472-20121206/27104_1 /TAXON_ID=693140 ORGANISM="Tiarina fusus, Strain LIS" /NCGR_SAMPLE_ID=MMETSP0472 /ASSEMBLY_ACC=CAM_ASM_000603 /LENGTH=340 /DNA_ID=CAMNT_0004748779 /DNA_START=209 /DNA_END=1231 /DNA_ORIENTATION=-
MERVFEESMGDDWRVFRAKLVAHEQTEARQAAVEWHRSTPRETIEEKGQMFGSEISSILFHGGSPTKSKRQDTQSHPKEQKQLSRAELRARLMKGDTVGVPPGQVQQTDPFASPAEKVCQIKPDQGLNKHRWAHPINHIEEGAVMIASEQLGGVFQQTVLLVVDHHEKTGTTAVVINRPIPGNLMELSGDMETNLEESVRRGFTKSTVSYGGPVCPEAFSCIHGFAEVDGSKKLAPGLFIGGSKELLNLVRLHRFEPENALFTQGHGAWGPGQMEEEIANGVWYPASCSADLMLRYAGAPTTSEDNLKDLWTDILTCMGGDYTQIARKYGSYDENKKWKP